jgi:hypothetical protein
MSNPEQSYLRETSSVRKVVTNGRTKFDENLSQRMGTFELNACAKTRSSKTTISSRSAAIRRPSIRLQIALG